MVVPCNNYGGGIYPAVGFLPFYPRRYSPMSRTDLRSVVNWDLAIDIFPSKPTMINLDTIIVVLV